MPAMTVGSAPAADEELELALDDPAAPEEVSLPVLVDVLVVVPVVDASVVVAVVVSVAVVVALPPVPVAVAVPVLVTVPAMDAMATLCTLTIDDWSEAASAWMLDWAALYAVPVAVTAVCLDWM